MGRPRKPADLLKLTGHFDAKRHANRGDVPQVGGKPEMPDFLDDGAKAVWADVVPQLVAAGIAKRIDSPALAVLCTALANYRKAIASAPHNAGRWWRVARPLLDSFGLTPAARQKLLIHHGADRPD